MQHRGCSEMYLDQPLWCHSGLTPQRFIQLEGNTFPGFDYVAEEHQWC